MGPFTDKFKIVYVHLQAAEETSKTYKISYFLV